MALQIRHSPAVEAHNRENDETREAKGSTMTALQFVLDHGIELAFTLAVMTIIVRWAWDFWS